MHSKSYPAVTSRVRCMWTAEGWGVFFRKCGNGRRIAESLSLSMAGSSRVEFCRKENTDAPPQRCFAHTHTHTHSLTYHAHHTHYTQYHAPTTTTQPHPSTTNPNTTKSTPISPLRSPKKRKNIHTPSRFRPTEGKMHNLQTPQ